MRSILFNIVSVFIFMVLSISSTVVYAADGDKAFAEKKIVLQISDPNPFKQTLVLNIANNLLKHYGTDGVEIEVVAFGPGLRLLFKENVNKGRIDSLVGSGVTFSACAKTLDGMAKKLGHKPALNSQADIVPGGVVQIIDLQDKGYYLIKP